MSVVSGLISDFSEVDYDRIVEELGDTIVASDDEYGVFHADGGASSDDEAALQQIKKPDRRTQVWKRWDAKTEEKMEIIKKDKKKKAQKADAKRASRTMKFKSKRNKKNRERNQQKKT